MVLHNCDFNKEAALGLLQAVGERRLSLTIAYENMYVFVIDCCIPEAYEHRALLRGTHKLLYLCTQIVYRYNWSAI